MVHINKHTIAGQVDTWKNMDIGNTSVFVFFAIVIANVDNAQREKGLLELRLEKVFEVTVALSR